MRLSFGLFGAIAAVSAFANSIACAQTSGSASARQLPASAFSSEAGTRARAFLDAYNSGSWAALDSFVARNLSSQLLERLGGAPAAAGIWASIMKQYGPVTPVQVERSTAREFRVLTFARLPEVWPVFGFTVDSAQPHKVVAQFFGIGEPDDSLRSAIAPRMIPSKRVIDSYLRRLAAADLFSGAVLVAHGDNVLYKKAFGYANKAGDVPNATRTRFSIASATKMFTAITILRLAEQHRLSLDDTIGRFLPELPARARREVKIRHLLTHTSGYTDYLVGDAYSNRLADLTDMPAYLSLVTRDSLRFAPGARFRYSNTGYLLLGVVAERASGKSFFDAVRSAITEPLRMRDTGPCDRAHPGNDQAIGYTYRTRPGSDYKEGPLRPNTDMIAARGSAAEGLCSTLDDLFKFARALNEGTLLNSALSREALRTQVVIDSSTTYLDSYGYGFEVGRIGPIAMVGHTGRLPGVSTSVEIYPAKDYTIIVLGNYEGVGSMVGGWLRRLFM